MKQKGFTLAELIVTIAILGILAVMMAPGFQSMIRNNRLTSTANLFLSALNLARSEAVNRNARVVLCKSINGTSCVTTGGYEQGWLLYVDEDSSGSVGGSDTLLRVQDKLPGELTLVGISTDKSIDDYISFVGDGRARALDGQLQNGSLNLCHGNHPGRIIRINTIGRVRVEAESSNVGSSICSG